MRLKTFFLAGTLSFSVASAGCGGGEKPAATPDPAAEDARVAAVESAGTASISGTIIFNGTAPRRRALNLDRECRDLHTEPVLTENLVVNDNNTLKWVFVYVKEGLEGRTFAEPTEPVVLDQRGCVYLPHVFGVQTGQTIKILNSDSLLHNIHALPEENRGFNFGMPNQGSERERSFRVPEVMVKIKCDVHPWMSAYAGVLDHPHYSVSGDDGAFNIEGLPAGTYTIEAWHESYGTQAQAFTVGEGEVTTVDFTFDATS